MWPWFDDYGKVLNSGEFVIPQVPHTDGAQCLSNTYTTDVLNCWSICNMPPYFLFPRRNVYWWRKSETFGYLHRVDKSKSKQVQLECNMAAPSGQRYPSVNKLLKYTVASCSSNHSHISSTWYVLVFVQWLLKQRSCHLYV